MNVCRKSSDKTVSLDVRFFFKRTAVFRNRADAPRFSHELYWQTSDCDGNRLLARIHRNGRQRSIHKDP